MDRSARLVGSLASLLLAIASGPGCASVVTPSPDPGSMAPAQSGETAPDPTRQDAGDVGPSTTPANPGGTTGGPGTDPSGGDLSTLTCQNIVARVGRPEILHAEAPPRVAFEWSIEQAPPTSQAQIELPDVRTPRFTPDVIGDWLIRVRTHDGQVQLGNCVIVLHAE